MDVLGGFMVLTFIPWAIGLLVIASIKILKQYENGVILTLGKYTGTYKPGLKIVIPIIQSMERVDLRLRTIDIRKQQIMTVDNVPVSVNGVIYFKVNTPEDAVLKVQDYEYAIAQFAETALRDVVGGMSLDSVLSERAKIGKQISEIVRNETKGWGLAIDHIKLQDVEVPDDLKRLMSRQAAAEREKRATVIKAEGDAIAAKNLGKAATIMQKHRGAMQLRTLQTLDGLGPTASNTVVVVPMDLVETIKKMKK
ncbi:MAG: SPFH domain-containing protein [Candidatus Woesearchaeota archaeon]|nr:SPFH domain-containing protein [Candidatus Woesearchaeota archaeon]